MDIVNIIDKMEALISTSVKVPATQRTLLDAKKMAELLDQLRLAVPQDVKAAEQILHRKEEILNQAEVEKRRLKSQAEEEFRTRLEESEVLKSARRKADQLTEEAERKTQKLTEQTDRESRTKRTEADAYAAQTLRNLERQLSSQLNSVRNGLAVLSGDRDGHELLATGNKKNGSS